MTGRNMSLVDVSHVIESGMITYQGLPAPIICDYLSREQSRQLYAPGTEFQIGKIEMVSNTGTHIDSPFHRYADGADLADLNLESVANLDCDVVRVAARQRAIGAEVFAGRALRGKAVDPDATGPPDLEEGVLGRQTAEEVRRSTLLHLTSMGVTLLHTPASVGSAA